MKTFRWIFAAPAALLSCLGGCASNPPAELRNARAAYQSASIAPGAELVASDLYDAKKSLRRAERAFTEHGDEPETRDLAYIAERRAMLAEASAHIALAGEQAAVARAEQVRQQRLVQGELGADKARLEQQLATERQARIAAEQRTAEALMKIEGLTAKQRANDLVLTIDGSFLFPSGRSDLLPSSKKRLDDIVTALRDDNRQITVAGHTDSVGDPEKNMRLSQLRADAVRTYVIARGLADDRIVAKGFGETQPVADNKGPEGRAINRRVEIILQGSALGATPPPPPTTPNTPTTPPPSSPLPR